MIKAVAYYRVSTRKQGASGLGMDAQRKAVEDCCAQRGLDLIAPPFEEIESGKRDDRPQLCMAIERCKLTGATLVVAKLDRLSRNVAFLATLQDSGIKFIAADMPEANELTVHILAAVAQAERKAISKRTIEALAAAKARGQKLGNPNGAAALRRYGEAFRLGCEGNRLKADRRAEERRATIARLRAAGHLSFGALANKLNAEGIETPGGRGRWHSSTVRNLIARLEA